MPELASRERLQPSLLDRLTDLAPEQKSEPADAQALTIQQLRQCVLRDLAWLLGTTNLEAARGVDLAGTPLAAASTVNFGIPGFAGMTSSGPGARTLEAMIARAIRSFEPRINPDSLRVRVRDMTADSGSASLVFSIEGEMWAQPVPLQLFLETAIELETREAVVVETRPTR